jgi:molecular chaperone GrpE
VQRVALTYREIFDSLIEGYDLILGRLQRAMKKADLYRIECVGRQADPNLVTVVEVVDDPLRPPGLVVEQIRPGYFWKDKVIRFAEVRAVQGRTASNP